MTSEQSAADRSRGRALRASNRRASPGLRRAFLAAQVGVLVLLPLVALGQAKRAPKPSPTPDPAIAQIESLRGELGEVKRELATLREDFAALTGRLDAIASTAAAIKGIAEPMREEVRGLYVESSNVRAEVARLEETYNANTESLAKSRYVLTLLLVATAVLQVVVLAVLLRYR